MSGYDNQVIEEFDFTDALRLPGDERIRVCVSQVKQRLTDRDLLDIFGIPPVPTRGASDAELDDLRLRLGVSLPKEYERFLQQWRYLILDDGYRVWGLDHDGVSIGWPWLSDQHRMGHRYLVFGDYWRYADGDQLMFDLDDPMTPVVAYLHEHGPLFEEYSPSFSLALWGMVREWLSDDEET
jgi:SMI1 / KNR4 family (SUKH-1)